MNRMWEIKEKFNKHFDMRSEEFEEGYSCGFEDGYEKALKETKQYYNERRMRY